MKKIAIVYWSCTGNTKAMAYAVAEGVKKVGGDAVIYTSKEFDVSILPMLDAVAFGCPASGAESLESLEFAPMFDACKNQLAEKKVALFGSYGWGDGEWMRTWEKDCSDAGITLACESMICSNTPDDVVIDKCRALGEALAE